MPKPEILIDIHQANRQLADEFSTIE